MGDNITVFRDYWYEDTESRWCSLESEENLKIWIKEKIRKEWVEIRQTKLVCLENCGISNRSTVTSDYKVICSR